jgi:hypothetical protein
MCCTRSKQNLLYPRGYSIRYGKKITGQGAMAKLTLYLLRTLRDLSAAWPDIALLLLIIKANLTH